VLVNLKEKKKPFLFLDLLGAVAKVLSMYCFSDKYGHGVGSYKKSKKIKATHRRVG
jgi:hypothetical protein